MKYIFSLFFVLLYLTPSLADGMWRDCGKYGCGYAFAKCKRNTFNVNYDANGGSGNAPTEPTSCTYGEDCLAPESTFTRTGYNFANWSCKKSDGTECFSGIYNSGESISTATDVDNDIITLIANWVVEGDYIISFNKKNGDLNSEIANRISTCNAETDTFELPTSNDITRENSIFNGWLLNGEYISKIEKGQCLEKMTFVADWSCVNGYALNDDGTECNPIDYTITYNSNGGTNSSTNPDSYNITSSQILLTAPTRPNSKFEGWYTTPEFTTTKTEITSGSFGNVELYAKWSCNEGYTANENTQSCDANNITIAYDTDGGIDVSDALCTYGENTSINVATTKQGYTFNGWKLANGTIVSIGSEFVCNKENLGVYEGITESVVADWTPNTYTINYECGFEESTAPTTGNAIYDTKYTVSENTCQRVGYTFAGWAVSDTETVLNSGDEIEWKYTSDKTLTAQWTANVFNVAYDANGGTGDAPSEPTSCTYDSDCVAPVNTYSKTGYTFAGWACTGGGELCDGDIIAAGDSLKNVSTGSEITLTAQWTANVFNVAYDANGGTGDAPSEPTSCTYDSDCVAPVNTYSKTGYTFAGWACTGGGESCDDDIIAAGDSLKNVSTGSGITLTAQWIANVFNVAYDANGGTGDAPSEPLNCTYDSDCVAPVNTYSKTGYEFVGWACTGGESCDGDIIAAGDSLKNVSTGSGITLTAQWSQNAFTCSAGTYLPAGSTECTACPAGSACAGGKYTYNTDKNQGITSCTGNTYSDANAATCTGCPDGYTADETHQSVTACKLTCEAGKYVAESGGKCVSVGVGNWSDGSETVAYGSTGTAHRCPDGFRDGNATTSEGGCIANCGAECTQKTCPKNSVNCKHGSEFESGTMTYANQTCSATAPVCSMTFECQAGYEKQGEMCVLLGSSIITYNTNGGSFAGEFTNACNAQSQTIVLPTDGKKTGYTFKGWYDEKGEAITQITREQCANAMPIKVSAKWTAKTYSAQYDCNGGTGDNSNVSIDYDAEFTVAGSCNRTGYTLTGWKIDDKDVSGTFKWNYVENKELVAQWTPNTYTVSYAGNGNTGGNAPSEPTSCTYNSDCVAPVNTYSKTGYTFAGWACTGGGKSCDGDIITAGDSLKNISTGSGITLTAQWTPNTYTVSYAGNGNTGGNAPTAPTSCTYDSDCVAPVNTYSKTGYTFAGWACTGGGELCDGDIIAAGDSLKNISTGSRITLTAQWTVKVFTCNAGTYLPAGATECSRCSGGSYCVGGTFNYNVVTSQGLTTCPSGYNDSDTGSDSESDCYRACELSDVPNATVIAPSNWFHGTNNSCEATACDANHYLDYFGKCVACDDGYTAPNNNNGYMDTCTKKVTETCTLDESKCPANATCTYNADTKEHTYTQGEVYVGAQEIFNCSVKEFTCNVGYTKTADGKACSGSAKTYKVIYHLGGGTNYDGAPTEFSSETGVTVYGTPTYSGFVFESWCSDASMTQCSNSVGVAPNAATGDLEVWAKWSPCPAGSYCNGFQELCPLSHPQSAPQSDSILDCYAICETRYIDNNLIQEPMNPIEYYGTECSYRDAICDAGYEMIDGRCYRCARNNAQTYTRGCKIESCISGYHPNDDRCEPNVIDCSGEVENTAMAQREWDAKKGRYSECKITECANGYHIDSNACVPDVEPCDVPNGIGERVWDNRTHKWGKCIAVNCEAGYTMDSSAGWEQCAPCDNMYGPNGEIAVSSYVRGCEIASCMYQGELYALENNECRLVCTEYSDETGSRYWDSRREKCVHKCTAGYTNW